MNQSEVPTKGNLIKAKNSLKLARQGYDLMDKKRNILIRELMLHIDKAKVIQDRIDETFHKAYFELQRANMETGITAVHSVALSVPIEETIEVKTRSIMGTEIPLVRYKEEGNLKPTYAFYGTRISLDRARKAFEDVKKLIIELTTVEISAYRLAANIKTTQKRANALKNITIPRYEALTRNITDALEEKEREEFTRLKVIKRQLNS